VSLVPLFIGFTRNSTTKNVCTRARVRPDRDKSLSAERFAKAIAYFRCYAIALHHVWTADVPRVTEGLGARTGSSITNCCIRTKIPRSVRFSGAPFMEYEAVDLNTFLQPAMLSGWGAYILTQGKYVNTLFSDNVAWSSSPLRSKNLAELRPYVAKPLSSS
jgi:hypothetical protein